MKKIGKLMLLIAFIASALNIVSITALFYNESIVRLLAYLFYGFTILGFFIFLKQIKPFSETIKLWIWFFSFYFTLGLLANGIYGTPVNILESTIPFVTLLSFSFFLSNEEYQPLMGKTIAITLLVSCIILIIFQRINFDLDHDGIYQYRIERAQGVYGDANNAALASLLSFVFIHHIFRPVTKFQKTLKFLAIIISLYAMILTFSKTGFVILLIVLGLTYHKWFNPKRIFLTMIIVPLLFFTTINFALESTYLSEIQKERVESVIKILSFQNENVQFSGRDVLLENMMNYIYENPILGNGINFSVNIRGHNTILGVWADAGIFTFLFFLFLLFRHFWISALSPPNVRYFLLSVFFILTIFMLSLQTVINQPYLIVIFVWIGYQMKPQELDVNSNKS